VTSVVISGYYGFGNTGDEAMLEATIEGLGRRLPALEVTVVSGRPEAVRAVHGVGAIAQLDVRGLTRALRRADLFLSGGGTLLQDATSWRNLVYHLGLFALARQHGAPSMIFAQGVGPVTSRIGRAMMPWSLRGLAAVTVRDEASALALVGLGVKTPAAEVTADPAFALTPCPAARAETVLRAAGAAASGGGPPGLRPFVALAPRGLWNRDYEADLLAAIGDWVAGELGALPLLVPMQYPDDLTACDMILARMHEPAAVLRERLTPRETMGVLGQAELVIGVRLHALIFGVAAGAAVAGVEYDPKVAHFLARLGHQPVATITGPSVAWVGPGISGAGPASEHEALLRRLRATWADRDEQRSRLAEVAARQRRLAERNFDVAAEVVQKTARRSCRAGETRGRP